MAEALNSPLWLRFGTNSNRRKGVYLADRHIASEEHRHHALAQGRYQVVRFDLADATVSDCDVCGQPGGLIEGLGELQVHYSGDDREAAESIFESWVS